MNNLININVSKFICPHCMNCLKEIKELKYVFITSNGQIFCEICINNALIDYNNRYKKKLYFLSLGVLQPQISSIFLNILAAIDKINQITCKGLSEVYREIIILIFQGLTFNLTNKDLENLEKIDYNNLKINNLKMLIGVDN